VYAGEPLLGLTVAEPSLLPAHKALVSVEPAAARADGCVTDAVAVIVHPFASVTVTVYAPTARLLAVCPVPPLGDQRYVYPGEPLLGVTVTEPLFPLLHNTFVIVELAAVRAVG